jgi:REP element-mobilizing transposase RayT
MLMSNHVHPLLTPDDTDAVSRTLQDLGRRSVPDSNDTDRRSGILGGMRRNVAPKCGVTRSQMYHMARSAQGAKP